MVELDFSDRENALAWFEAQSVEKQCAISSRAALRVISEITGFSGPHKPSLILTALRATLISAALGMSETTRQTDLKVAAISAVGGARVATTRASNFARSTGVDPRRFNAVSASYTALSAGRVATSSDRYVAASAATSTALRSFDYTNLADPALSSDARKSVVALVALPIWNPKLPIHSKISNRHNEFLEYLESHPDWAFWRRWYQAMWDGTFRDWELALEVATLPDHLWEDDDALAKVAEAIREIEARLVSERLPQIEDVFETESGLYNVRSAVSDPSSLVDSAMNRVGFALNLALQSNACDLNEMSIAAKLLRHALENCADDPNALEQFFRQASSLISDGIRRGIYGEDDTLAVLVATLDEVALQMRADHPDVAAASEARTEQAVRELSDAERLRGAGLIEGLKEGTTDRLHTELELASETARDGSSPVATAAAFKQSGNRGAKISLAERAKKAEGSGAMSALKIGLRADKLVEFVQSLLSGGGG